MHFIVAATRATANATAKKKKENIHINYSIISSAGHSRASFTMIRIWKISLGRHGKHSQRQSQHVELKFRTPEKAFPKLNRLDHVQYETGTKKKRKKKQQIIRSERKKKTEEKTDIWKAVVVLYLFTFFVCLFSQTHIDKKC